MADREPEAVDMTTTRNEDEEVDVKIDTDEPMRVGSASGAAHALMRALSEASNGDGDGDEDDVGAALDAMGIQVGAGGARSEAEIRAVLEGQPEEIVQAIMSSLLSAESNRIGAERSRERIDELRPRIDKIKADYSAQIVAQFADWGIITQSQNMYRDVFHNEALRVEWTPSTSWPRCRACFPRSTPRTLPPSPTCSTFSTSSTPSPSLWKCLARPTTRAPSWSSST